MIWRNKYFFFFVSLAAIAATATWLVIYSTPQGLGLSDDSIAYIAGARSLLMGNGYKELWLASNQPVTHLPPGLSSLFAITGYLTGLDPLRGVRLVNGSLFGINTFLLGIISWRLTRSQVAGIILAILFAVNASMLRLHSDAMSEPLFIFLTLLTFLSFARYYRLSHSSELNPQPSSELGVNNNQLTIWLILTGCMTGVSYLTRYAGLALLATILLALLLLNGTWGGRIKAPAIFLSGFLPWFLAWSIRNRLFGGTTTNRALQWHPITSENFQIAIYNVSEFLIPIESWRRSLIRIPGFFEIAVGMIGLGLITWLIFFYIRFVSGPQLDRPEILAWLNGLFVFAYLLSIIFAMTFFDASTKFRLRILAPVYVSLLVLLVASGMWLWNRWKNPLRSIVLVTAILLFGLSLVDTSQVVAELHKGGQGYASFQWYDSKAMGFLRGLSPSIKIYTNEPGAVYLYVNRGAYVLPTHTDPVTAEERSGFDEGVEIVREEVLSGIAVLALFDGGETLPEDTTALTKDLYLAHKSAGDEIYTQSP